MIRGPVLSPLICGRGGRGRAGRTWGWAESEDSAQGLHGTLRGLKVDRGATGHGAGSSRAGKESRWALPRARGGAGAPVYGQMV